MNEILQKRIEEAAKVFSFNFPSELFHSLQTQHERKLWKDEIEQAYIYGGEDSLQNQWISIEEALPDDNENVLLLLDDGHIIVAYHSGNYWWWRDGYVCGEKTNGQPMYSSSQRVDDKPTHWMNIPSLKGGEG